MLAPALLAQRRSSARTDALSNSPRAQGSIGFRRERSALAQVPGQDALAKAQRGGRHLEELVLLQPLEGPLDLHLARRREDGVLVLAGGADVGELLRAHGVHVHVARSAVLAEDLALVDGDPGADEEDRALLDVEEAVGGGLAGLGRDHGAGRAARELAGPGLVAAHRAVEDALAARRGEELAAVAEEAAARRDEDEAGAPLPLLHREHATAARGEPLDDDARGPLGHLREHVLDRLAAPAVDLAADDLGARDRELVALATQRLDQDPDLELAA